MGNPIFEMMSGASGTGISSMPSMPAMGGTGDINQFANMLNNRFGSMQKCLGMLNGLIGKRGMSPQGLAMQEIKGKHYSPETIEKFKVFARNNGANDNEINMVLNQLGLS